MNKPATLVGCAIGDALGNPFEMRKSSYKPLIEWGGSFKDGGTFWKGKAGQYTDDTMMSVALAESIIANNGFDPDHVAQSYLNWYNGPNTRGMGSTTALAMKNLKRGATWQQSGIARYNGLPAAGNGTAMRASPIGLLYRNFDASVLTITAETDAIITHNSVEAKDASKAVVFAHALIANGKTRKDYLIIDILPFLQAGVVKDTLTRALYHLNDNTVPDVALRDLATTGNMGYVPETVASAFFCFGASASFKECVVMSIKCGGDTDTTAAVAGALAGTYYGLDGIPGEYRTVENFEYLQELTDKLMNIVI